MFFNYENIPYESMIYAKPRKINNGNKHYCVNIYSHNDTTCQNENMYIQTPSLKVNSNVDDDYMNFIHTNDIFRDKIQALEEHLIDVIKQNKEEWFPGKEITDTFLDVGLVPSIYKDKIKNIKIDKDLKVFDASKQEIKQDELNINDEVKCIFQINGIWFTTSRWGVAWKVLQIKSMKKTLTNTNVGYMFPDEDEDDLENIEPPPGI
jgi:hypothetical protein